MKCSNCGAEMIGGAKFCGECGGTASRNAGVWLERVRARFTGHKVPIRKIGLLVAAAVILTAAWFLYERSQDSDIRVTDFPWPVKIGDKCGYIDESGKLIIGLNFKQEDHFDQEGMAPVQDENGLWGFIDREGNWIIRPQYSLAQGFGSGNLAPVWSNSQTEEYGFIDRSGKLIVPYKFTGTARNYDKFHGYHGFIHGLALYIEQSGSGDGNEKYGYFDISGKTKIPAQFQYASLFDRSGLAVAEISGKFGYIDTSGSFVIPPQYDAAYDAVSMFAKNDLAAVGQGGRWGFIDRNGRYIINPQYDRASGFSKTGISGIKVGSKWGFINDKGKIIIIPQFDNILPYSNLFSAMGFPFEDDGYIPVQSGALWGYVNAGGIVIQPQFAAALPFSKSGLAAVEINNRWGFIDKGGHTVIAPQFDSPGCP